MRAFLFASLCLAAFPVKADTFAANKQPVSGDFRYFDLQITSKVDDLTIDHIDVNRGCLHGGGVPLPINLKFGQTFNAGTYYCDPIEVVIDTPRGNTDVHWNMGAENGLVANKYNIPSAIGSPNFSPMDNWTVILTSLENSITVKSVTVNKGKCRYTSRLLMPETPDNQLNLTYGERFAVGSYECNPLNVSVETNMGTMDFNWDQ